MNNTQTAPQAEQAKAPTGVEKKVLEFVLENGSINTYQCQSWQVLNSGKLAEYIRRLERKGYNFERIPTTFRRQDGKYITFTTYKLCK